MVFCIILFLFIFHFCVSCLFDALLSVAGFSVFLLLCVSNVAGVSGYTNVDTFSFFSGVSSFGGVYYVSVLLFSVFYSCTSHASYGAFFGGAFSILYSFICNYLCICCWLCSILGVSCFNVLCFHWFSVFLLSLSMFTIMFLLLLHVIIGTPFYLIGFLCCFSYLKKIFGFISILILTSYHILYFLYNYLLVFTTFKCYILFGVSNRTLIIKIFSLSKKIIFYPQKMGIIIFFLVRSPQNDFFWYFSPFYQLKKGPRR